MINSISKTLIIVGIAAAIFGGTAQAKNNKGFQNTGIKKSDIFDKNAEKTKRTTRKMTKKRTNTKRVSPTQQKVAARKNKDEYFRCAKFSTAVLNACIGDANRKGATTKPCLQHYQANIQRCQAKFL